MVTLGAQKVWIEIILDSKTRVTSFQEETYRFILFPVSMGMFEHCLQCDEKDMFVYKDTISI